MFTRTHRTLPLISTLALWGLLASVPQTVCADGTTPTIRGQARLDAVLPVDTLGSDKICANNGAGGFAACNTFNGLDSSRGLVLGDINADGLPDAVLANSSELAKFCLNNGSGGFGACATFNTADSANAVALGDINNDGWLDAVVANFASQPDRLCLNNGSGGFGTCSSFNGLDISRSVALGDVNGDGWLDVVMAADTSTSEKLCLNNGSGVLSGCTTFNGTDNTIGIALGDINNDGWLDVVVTNGSGAGNAEKLCLNNGSGGFPLCSSFNSIETNRGVALGDINSDGWLDAVLSASTGGDKLCLNSGTGGFGTCSSFNAADSSPGVALGDINNDGLLDAVLVNIDTAADDRLCLNNGAGGFAPCTGFNTADNNYSVALGRLDNDGLTDVTPKFVGGVTTSNFGLTMASMVTGVKPAGLVALYQFDTKYCSQSLTETLDGLRTRVVRVTQGNALNFNGLTSAQYLTAPEWREGGIGAELVIPTAGQTFGYADGFLDFGECAVITYQFNLFSLGKYRFAVRLYGNVSMTDTLPDSLVVGGSVNDLNAAAATEIELDLGALQATTETPSASVPPAGSPPVTTPGGTAPTPVTPTTLSFPAGTSNLPSRR